MLCDLVEDGQVATRFIVLLQLQLTQKPQETCYQYWPQTGMVKFGEYTVDLTEEQTVIGYTIRKLSLSNTEVSMLVQNYLNVSFMLYNSLEVLIRLYSCT